MDEISRHYCADSTGERASLEFFKESSNSLKKRTKVLINELIIIINMLRLIIIVLLSVSINHGSCTSTRIILDGNTKDVPTLGLTSWDLWDTDVGLFSPRISQFDGFGQLRDFGKYPGKIQKYKNLPRMLETRCENLEDLKRRNIFMSSGLGATVRCRRTIREWTMQEPLYVDEPRWVPVEVKDMNDDPAFEEEDPFILARGKRSILKKKSSRSKREVSRNDKPKKNGDNEDSMRNVYKVFGEYLEGRSGYVQPRDKHSDIMDILSEPFIISRGKKTRKNDFEGNSEDNSLNSEEKHRAMRDRRGEIIEQLLKEQDPFYIARGRRTKDILSLFQNLEKK